MKIYRLITRNSYEREMFDKASLKLGLDKAVLQSMSGRDSAANGVSRRCPAHQALGPAHQALGPAHRALKPRPPRCSPAPRLTRRSPPASDCFLTSIFKQYFDFTLPWLRSGSPSLKTKCLLSLQTFWF